MHLALLLTLIFHEFGHGFIARFIYGLHPTVYGLHEDDITSSNTAIGVIASAGPLIGLLIGFFFLFIVHKRQTGQGFDRYLTLWLGVLGIVAFFGYLLTAPFYATGDVRVVLISLGLTSPIFSWISFVIVTEPDVPNLEPLLASYYDMYLNLRQYISMNLS